MRPALIALAAFTLIWACPTAFGASQIEVLGPSPYTSFPSSPFYGGTYDYFHLETFEDYSLNTPGVSASAGGVVGPSHLTDSVDGDDGVIDGYGQDGHSYYLNRYTYSVDFTFNASILGQLPTNDIATQIWPYGGGWRFCG